MSARRRWLLVFVVALVAATGAGIVIGLLEGNGDPSAPETKPAVGLGGAQPVPSSDGARRRYANPRHTVAERQAEQADAGQQVGPSGPAPSSKDERGASAAVKDLLGALNAGDGVAVCDAFAPGALEAVEFPKPRAGCPASVEASLGYRDPRGLPVWRSSKPTDAISAQVDGDDARVTATIITLYAGGTREPSIEDDVLYLQRSGGRWLLVKPSSTFYRAIGVADVPPSVLAPPS